VIGKREEDRVTGKREEDTVRTKMEVDTVRKKQRGRQSVREQRGRHSDREERGRQCVENCVRSTLWGRCREGDREMGEREEVHISNGLAYCEWRNFVTHMNESLSHT